jgi:hypothetical protein
VYVPGKTPWRIFSNRTGENSMNAMIAVTVSTYAKEIFFFFPESASTVALSDNLTYSIALRPNLLAARLSLVPKTDD